MLARLQLVGCPGEPVTGGRFTLTHFFFTSVADPSRKLMEYVRLYRRSMSVAESNKTITARLKSNGSRTPGASSSNSPQHLIRLGLTLFLCVSCPILAQPTSIAISLEFDMLPTEIFGGSKR